MAVHEEVKGRLKLTVHFLIGHGLPKELKHLFQVLTIYVPLPTR